MLSESFQRQVQLALERQLQEHEQIAARFVETVASICEGERCDGASVAQVLRNASRAASSAKTSQDLPRAQNRSEASSDALDPFDSRRPRGSVASVDNNRHGDNLADMDKTDRNYMKAEFALPQCNFMGADGQIRKPPSELQKLVGKRCGRMMRFKKRMTGEGNEHKEHSFLERFIDSSPFKTLSVLAITLNYFFIIAQTDNKMADMNGKEPFHFRVIDLMFTCYYTFEVGTTLMALRLQFFFGFDSSWNMFDLVIVFFSVGQEFLNLFDVRSIDTSFLRVLRFLRISKILRMFEAMRALKEVKIMVDSLMGSFFIFMCCCLMFALYLSVFSIFFVQGFTSMLEQEKPGDPLPQPWKHLVTDDFGSVMQSMMSLFMALTGGKDWGEYFDTIQEMGALYTGLFIFFYLFALMAFFNVVTGVFCEKAMSLARPGAHEMMIRKRGKEVRDATELVRLVKKVLGSPDGTPPILTSGSFKELLRDQGVVEYFESRGLNPSTAHRFFEVLSDINQTGEVDFSSFVSACVKLDGPASSIDLHVLSVELKAVQMSLHNLHMQNSRRHETILSEMHGVPAVQANAPFHVSTIAAQPSYQDSYQPSYQSINDVQLEMIPTIPMLDPQRMDGFGVNLDPSGTESLSYPFAPAVEAANPRPLEPLLHPSPGAPSKNPPPGITYTYHEV